MGLEVSSTRALASEECELADRIAEEHVPLEVVQVENVLEYKLKVCPNKVKVLLQATQCFDERQLQCGTVLSQTLIISEQLHSCPYTISGR